MQLTRAAPASLATGRGFPFVQAHVFPTLNCYRRQFRHKDYEWPILGLPGDRRTSHGFSAWHAGRYRAYRQWPVAGLRGTPRNSVSPPIAPIVDDDGVLALQRAEAKARTAFEKPMEAWGSRS